MPDPIHSLATPGATACISAGSREGQDCAAQPGQAVTSHSWSLSTGAFNLDFTWRRVESLSNEASALNSRRAAPAAAPASNRATTNGKPRQSFQEVLRRRQLGQLLLATNRPPQDRQPLLPASEPASPQPGPVCRAYAQARGPLEGPGRTFSA